MEQISHWDWNPSTDATFQKLKTMDMQNIT